MTVTTDVTPSPSGTPRPASVEPGPGGLFRAVARAEWTKMRTVRSTVWSLLVTIGLTVGLGALFAAARVSRWDTLGRAARVDFDPTRFSLNGLLLAQLAIGVLGVLMITSEYATGQIRATFGATPQRLTVLVAKVVVFVVVVLVVGLVSCFTAFGIGQSIFAGKHAGASLGDPDVLRAVIGGALYLAALGALGIGLGVILRRTAGAIATLVGLLLVAPVLASFLPSPWNDDIQKYLPGLAGGAIFRVIPEANALSPWAGFAVLVGYAVASLVVGGVLLVMRDA